MLSTRFWSKVQKTSDCWLWVGGKNRAGYGHIYTGAYAPQKEIRECAHRVAWRLTYGAIPDGLYVLHHCDNPRCVRPDHLFLGTQQDNMDDMAAKGRRNTAKLTEADVCAIRARYAAGGILQQTLADQYRVSQSIISLIIRREKWRHI